jgi:hypothetical protein
VEGNLNPKLSQEEPEGPRSNGGPDSYCFWKPTAVHHQWKERVVGRSEEPLLCRGYRAAHHVRNGSVPIGWCGCSMVKRDWSTEPSFWTSGLRLLVASLGFKRWGVGQLVDDPASFVRRGGSIPRDDECRLKSPSSTGYTGLA